MFKLSAKYTPSGDQPAAIEKLCKGVLEGRRNQVLLGVTGSGKTFTMANVIAAINRPTLVMAHNKTLAAQLYGELKEFFPENAIEYFVSYYDYYQPEAYIAKTDTYIEKDSSINDQLDLLRHSATVNLLEREDVVIVSSVSCIYGIGDKENYSSFREEVKIGHKFSQDDIITKLVDMQYERCDGLLERGRFRVRGYSIDISPCHIEDYSWRLIFDGDIVEKIYAIDSVSSKKLAEAQSAVIYPNKHFTTPFDVIKQAVPQIRQDLEAEVSRFMDVGKVSEAKRLQQRTNYDIEMLLATGMCKGIENYSRYIEGRPIGSAPNTLLGYLPKDALLVVDESHITVPQIGGMFSGDRSRKESLVSHGFRMESALDNRPLTAAEWNEIRPNTVFVSATPGKFEIEATQGEVVEQIIRPTGLLDPICEIRPIDGQVHDLMEECRRLSPIGGKVLALTTTKKWAERLNDYLNEHGIRSSYLHSEVKTFERVEVINRLRSGEIDVIVGINLLREGIDIPECMLVAILDADKEGFLRNETSLIQTIGRAARNEDGRVILYADKETTSIKNALAETRRRRTIQEEHNAKHGITPRTVKKEIKTIFDEVFSKKEADAQKQEALNNSLSDASLEVLEKMSDKQIEKHISKLRRQMKEAAKNMDFEKASQLRDSINLIQKERISPLV